MTGLMGLIIIISWNLLELINVLVLVRFFLQLPRKNGSLREIIAKSIGYFLIIAIYSYLVLSRCQYVYVAFIFTVLIFLKSGLILSAIYKLELRHFTMIAFFVELVSFIGYNASIIIKKVFTINQIISHENELIGELTLSIILIILVTLKRYNIINIWIAELSCFDHLLFIVILFFTSVLETKIFADDAFSFGIKNVFRIVIVALVILVIKVIVITEKNNSLEDVNLLLELQIKEATDYYNELIEKDNQVKKFRHDIKNFLIVLHAMIDEGENEKAKTYIEELQGVCSQLRHKFDTGNFMADAILSAKETKAAQFNTDIVFKGFIPAEKVKDTDMVVVLSNVLDNAIEACEKVEGKKTIEIDSVLKKKIWVLSIRNPSMEVNVRNNQVATSKLEKNLHGFGLVNIEKVAKKYAGNMQIKYSEGYFYSKITFIFE